MADPSTSPLAQAIEIDHIAIATPDLEAAVRWFTEVLGFEVVERRLTQGRRTAMVSAVIRAGNVTLVLLAGTSPESQVSRYVSAYGPGVQHIALRIPELDPPVSALVHRGARFATDVLKGHNMRQIFTTRDPASGMMVELIERNMDSRFTDHSVQQLFEQLEAKDLY